MTEPLVFARRYDLEPEADAPIRRARPKRDLVPVSDQVRVERAREHDGNGYLAVTIDPDDPYRSWKRLPDALEYEGRVYGKTGYNSDTNLAYYGTDAPLARAPLRRR